MLMSRSATGRSCHWAIKPFRLFPSQEQAFRDGDRATSLYRVPCRMGFRLLESDDMHWRPTNVLGAENVDLAIDLGADELGARLWRFRPGEASLAHRHREQPELYLLLQGTGRIRIANDVLTLQPMTALVVDLDTVRQIVNDTPNDQLWLVVGAPREWFKIPELSDDERAHLYPDGLTSLPSELRRSDLPTDQV